MVVEPLTPKDKDAARRVLVRAFVNNPGVVALLREHDEGRRAELLDRGMRGFVRATLYAGTAELVRHEGRVAAVSLWFAPGQYPLGAVASMLMGYGPVSAGPRRLLRYMRFDQYMRRHHIRDPHFYLWFIGVDPDLQGRGIGSVLLRDLVARADGAEVPCYLETDKESSVRLYARYGFEVKADETNPEFGFRMWFMVRPPRP